LIADAAAGDARTAIGILRNAARTAHRDRYTEISEAVIEAAIPEAKSEIQNKSLSKLTDHQHTLYEIIEDAGEIDPGALYDRYTDRVSDPKTKRTMRNHLQKMEHYNLISAEGATRGRTYQLVHDSAQ
jgi:Cdc6-like AAA superfamily ATPase